MPASTAAGEMDNFQLSISLSETLSERRREGKEGRTDGRTDADECNEGREEGRGRRPRGQIDPCTRLGRGERKVDVGFVE